MAQSPITVENQANLTGRESTPLHWASVCHWLGVTFWVAALALPAIESPALIGGPDDTADLPGWVCFVGTLVPTAWFSRPLVFAPLLLVNIWTILTPIFFLGGIRNGLPISVVIFSFLCIPLALISLSIAIQLYVGFFLWLGSLALFSVANALLFATFLRD